MGKIIKHQDLDTRLNEFAKDPEGFHEHCAEYARELDQADVPLEITDPTSWRRAVPEGLEDARVTLRQQFRADVETIELIDRPTEARLARRIEFARIRFDLALARHGMTREDLAGGGVSVGRMGAACDPGSECTLPGSICRRWLELHALRTELVERNLYLVLINVERYSHTTASQADLIQEGSAALFRAVDGFDWRRGLLFRTYAVHWLNQAFRSYLYNFSNTVRVPVYLQKALKHINDAKARLGDSNASVEKLADATQLGENLVSAALSAVRSNRSIDVSFDEDGDGGRLRDLLPDDSEGPYTSDIEDISLEQSLEGALSRLSDRECYVVRQRFGIGVDREHTLAEVAAELGVSLERVRQIQVRALGKMRTPGLRRVVDPFLN